MTDRLSKETRSALMGRVKGGDTKPELAVRSALHRAGFRFALHKKGLPGKPDLVLTRYKTIVFVHGCFWHGHSCSKGRLPKSNEQFWQIKIAGNRKRDLEAVIALEKAGWAVHVLWECDLANEIDGLLRNLQERRRVLTSATEFTR